MFAVCIESLNNTAAHTFSHGLPALIDGAPIDGALIDGALIDGALIDGALIDCALKEWYLAFLEPPYHCLFWCFQSL